MDAPTLDPTSTPNPTPQPYHNLPDELMVEMIKGVPDVDWPKAWFTMRGISRSWRSETEVIFRQKHLPNLAVSILLHNFSVIPEESKGPRVVLKPQRTIEAKEWTDIMWRARLRYTERRPHFHAISLVDMAVANDTELVGLELGESPQTISFELAPTIDKLFGEEMQIRREICKEAERQLALNKLATTKSILLYMLHKSQLAQTTALMKVRSRPYEQFPVTFDPIHHGFARDAKTFLPPDRRIKGRNPNEFAYPPLGLPNLRAKLGSGMILSLYQYF
ncbi:hypothetical protein ONZ43_g386 [Nemania bipapillata]|uniref:Uncharacterized protein n=1 Tax=Nemania bipapillata TaxID=110536 RepID=A0ACC2J8J9_9PEZI|nr:hypothetical protein ONZ43_g386 [Nemania bipapillata]